MTEIMDENIPKKSNAGKYIGGGCLIIVIALIVGMYFVYRTMMGAVENMVNLYTDTVPMEIPTLNVSAEDSTEIIDKYDQFVMDLAEGKSTPALELSAQNINQLIQYHPSFKPMSKSIYVSIEDNKIKGDISLPLDQVAPIGKGRYLNGTAIIEMQLNLKRLFVFINYLEVNGEAVPDEIMQKIKSVNFAEDMNSDPKIAEIIQRIKHLMISDGMLRVETE